MPHLILECSDNIREEVNTKILFPKLHTLLCEVGPFQLIDIKSRLIRHSEFLVGDGIKSTAFIHLQLAIISGRDISVKEKISTTLLKFLEREYAKSVAELNCSITVEIRDLEKESYMKIQIK